MSSSSFPTTASKDGIAKTIWSRENVQSAHINPEDLTDLTDGQVAILDGLTDKFFGKQKICSSEFRRSVKLLFQEGVYLGDWISTKKNCSAKKTKKSLSKEEKAELKIAKDAYAEVIEENKKNCWTESSPNWLKVNGKFGGVYCDDKLKTSDGKSYEPYFWDFNEAIARADEIGCEAITKTSAGYSLRGLSIPIENPTSKWATGIASWTRRLPTGTAISHSRTSCVNSRKTARKYELENLKMMARTKYLVPQVPEPEVESEVDEPEVESEVDEPVVEEEVDEPVVEAEVDEPVVEAEVEVASVSDLSEDEDFLADTDNEFEPEPSPEPEPIKPEPIKPKSIKLKTKPVVKTAEEIINEAPNIDGWIYDGENPWETALEQDMTPKEAKHIVENMIVPYGTPEKDKNDYWWCGENLNEMDEPEELLGVICDLPELQVGFNRKWSKAKGEWQHKKMLMA
tara:strand:- start:44 stop:1411 length:1368 start_codon:yes stop_codon:yes gene_type:complete